MARNFKDNQSSNKKSPNPYNPQQKNSKIQKITKKDNQVQASNVQKPQSNTKPPAPQPNANPVQNKPISEAGKNNLAKLASINQLMGVNLLTPNPKSIKAPESTQQVSSKSLVRKPSPQQISQALESLKDLQNLLDSYDELEMDQSSNLKSLLEFLDQRKVNPEQEKEEKVSQ